MPDPSGWRRRGGAGSPLEGQAFRGLYVGAARPRGGDPGRLRGGCLLQRCLLLCCLQPWLLLAACGPSFEVLAEGDLRFVHCDRLDLDPNIAPSHRLHCWREWRRMYTYGQTRDRVEYAQRRIAEVVSGDTEPPFQLPSGADAVARHTPMRAVAKEPAVVPVLETASAAPSPSTVSLPDSTQAAVAPHNALVACQARCEAASASCLPGCETRPTGCKPCETPLEACIRDCQPEAH